MRSANYLGENTSMVSGGACTDDDGAVLEKLGGGSEGGSFPGIGAACAKKSVGWKGFNKESHAKCIVKKTAVSLSCARCVAIGGAFGFKKCKMACMSNWCS